MQTAIDSRNQGNTNIGCWEEKKIRGKGYLRINIDVTQSCQFGCTYCYFGEKRPVNADVKKIISAVKNLVDALEEKIERVHVSYMGGEPTIGWPIIREINENLSEILGKMGIGYSWAMTSNLVGLDREKVDYMITTGAEILSSFDGPSDIQNKNRPYANGKGSYDDAVKKVPLALEVSKKKKARATVCPEDSYRIPEIANEIFDLGFKEVAIFPNVHGDWSANQVEAWGNGIAEAIDLYDSDTRLVSTIIVREGDERDQTQGIRNCGMGERLFALSTYGALFPCHRLTQSPDFRVIDASFAEPSVIRQSIIVSRELFNVNAISECSSCIARYRCGGGCLADNALVNGDPHLLVRNLCELKRRTFSALKNRGISYRNRGHKYSMGGICIISCDCPDCTDNNPCDSGCSDCHGD